MDVNCFNPSSLLQKAEAMDFLNLGQFGSGDCGAFWSEAGPTSPWEMHPDCDELLHIIEGKVEVEILPEDGSAAVSKTVSAGDFIVIPQNCWHRQIMLEKTKELFVTPGPTLHSSAEDPRI